MIKFLLVMICSSCLALVLLLIIASGFATAENIFWLSLTALCGLLIASVFCRLESPVKRKRRGRA